MLIFLFPFLLFYAEYEKIWKSADHVLLAPAETESVQSETAAHLAFIA